MVIALSTEYELKIRIGVSNMRIHRDPFSVLELVGVEGKTFYHHRRNISIFTDDKPPE